MTGNHLLLYHLAELMYEHEQNILPVDVLFDDDQIGDFVKSIQIDSPYQQMLLEGVLTESVHDEKLFVSFTVEGYFHYLLGEVIYNRTEVQSAEALKQIVEENKLNGVKEGVEQCLIRDIQKDVLTRLLWMIDNNEVFIRICVFPVLVGFKSRYQISKQTDQKNTTCKITDLIANLMDQTTEMDFKLIYEVIALAQKLNLIGLANEITTCLIKSVNLQSESAVILISKVLEFLQDYKLRLITVDKLKNWQKNTKVQGITELEIYSGIAKTYQVLHFINEAELYYKKCLKIELVQFGENHLFTSTSYNQIGLLKLQKGHFNSGLKYFKKSLTIKTKIFHESSSEITTSLHNIALTYQYLLKYEKCIKQYESVLTRRLKTEGKISLDTSLTLSNLGIAYAQSKINLEKAEQLLWESFELNVKILGSPNIRNNETLRSLAFLEWQKQDCDLVKVNKLLINALNDNILFLGKDDLSTAYCHDDLCQFYLFSHQLSKARTHGKKAIVIYRVILGDNHTHTLNLVKKLNVKNNDI
jgi:tetratricopeptide (TPR) repeat protein